MSSTDPKKVTIEGVDYAIYKFHAFYAANLSGELGRFIGPILVGLSPILSADRNKVVEMQLKDLMPTIIQSLKTLDGDELERLLRRLLIDQKNIACEYKDDTGHVKQEYLNEELVDRFFSGKIDQMLELAIDVINVNYEGFFGSLLNLYGSQPENSGEKSTSSDMEILT